MIVKYLVLDVDGTLTDGKIYMGYDGELFKAFYAHDGIGLRELIKTGVIPLIITGRKSLITENRCRELGIKHVYQDIQDKKIELIRLSEEMNFALNEVAYIGDDINDLEAMEMCKLKACPKDAVNEIKNVADFISKYNGGDGAVREFVEYIIRVNKDIL